MILTMNARIFNGSYCPWLAQLALVVRLPLAPIAARTDLLTYAMSATHKSDHLSKKITHLCRTTREALEQKWYKSDQIRNRISGIAPLTHVHASSVSGSYLSLQLAVLLHRSWNLVFEWGLVYFKCVRVCLQEEENFIELGCVSYIFVCAVFAVDSSVISSWSGCGGVGTPGRIGLCWLL